MFNLKLSSEPKWVVLFKLNSNVVISDWYKLLFGWDGQGWHILLIKLKMLCYAGDQARALHAHAGFL